MVVRSADPTNVQSDYDEWCERWAAALDATRDLEWAEILAVISGSAVRALLARRRPSVVPPVTQAAGGAQARRERVCARRLALDGRGQQHAAGRVEAQPPAAQAVIFCLLC